MKKYIPFLIIISVLLLVLSCTPPSYNLTVDTNGNGTVNLDPTGGTYEEGTTVNLTATPDTGWEFSGWSGDLSGSNSSESITMDSDKTVTAEFTQITHTLTVNVTPSAGGSVSPNGGTYNYGEDVTLTATPNTGYDFVQWTGDATGTSDIVTVNMDSDKTVTAEFTQITHTLTVDVSPAATSSVTLDPSGGTYNYGDTVTITPTANSGYVFYEWSGDAGGNDNPLTIIMDSDKNITANFVDYTVYIILENNIDLYPDDLIGVLIGDDNLVYADAGSETGYNANTSTSTWTEITYGVDYPNESSPVAYTLSGPTENLDILMTWDELPHGGVAADGYNGDGYYFPIAEFDQFLFEAGKTYRINGNGIVEESTDNYTLSGSWWSSDPNDGFVVSSRTLSVKSNKDSITGTDSNTYQAKDYNKQAELGAFNRIQVIFKDKSKILTKNGDIPAIYEKYGEMRYYPDNPIPELTIVEPDLRSNVDWNKMIDYYNSLPEVKFAGPDYINYEHWTPNDTFFTDQWQMQSTHLNMEAVWDVTQGVSTVKVAVIDSGLATGGVDTPVNVDTANQENFTDEGGSTDVSDTTSGHGTHVSGTIAQATNNGQGASGMAPNVTILPLKVFSNTSGSGSTSWIMNAIQHCIDLNQDGDTTNDVHVINMSLGSVSYVDTYYQPFQDVITDAFNAGIAIFAATGNSAQGWDTTGNGNIDTPYNGSISYPAAYDNVMAVGATDYNDERSYYSQYGSGYSSTDPAPIGTIDIVAPGGDVTADVDNDGYNDGILQETNNGGSTYTFEFWQGTSMATPHVAGLAALIKSVDSSFTPQQIYDVITATADTSMSGYSSNEYGSGIIDPWSVIQFVSSGSYSIGDTITGEIVTNGEINGDVWEINVEQGTIELNLYFSHSNDGNLDMKLYDPSGSEVAVSNSTTDNENISYDVDSGSGSGIYKIVVYAESLIALNTKSNVVLIKENG